MKMSLLTLNCNLQRILLYSANVFRKSCLVNVQQRMNTLHTSNKYYGLMEFFDDKKNWTEKRIDVGRPWKKDELRLKSNTDLHKLWYVLLKERNMLMTMEEEYTRLCEIFPNPERFDKVEESMENVIEVVQERDRAYHLLETGESGEPGQRWVYNVLGEGEWRQMEEHAKPMHENEEWKDSDKPSTNRFQWAVEFKKLYREKLEQKELKKQKKDKKKTEKLKKMYPDLEVD